MKGRVKYYFRKPKGEITEDILIWIAVAGLITIAATSPYFVRGFLRTWARAKRYKQRSLETAFQRLRKEGAIAVEKRRGRYAIWLTELGKKKAGMFQIDLLKISKPKVWDGKWRLLIFDVKQTERWKRDVLRSFLRRLEFVQFQKSVWIHPYDCNPEIEILKELIGLTQSEVKVIVAENVGKDETKLRSRFRLLKGNSS
ncbi:MAG: hypothetical protein A3A27_02080 [Candidatus Wildermuthbacteria bacterium RIFCSPLOWO2_01_FULL_47_18]|uniref:Transcriptional repressor PaaX-like central Cas2-like domain-containing protein n=1 Tax=Candidatus Wildermuthbacteria bacterium RIFCSPLOWO2_01_FULL_47_18 TaxID=1802460 RepID=A0A1G2RHL7_9BACT|nr:MAG: hypothetical protein A3A27_02080 [Candidatus Wildermuthbacteria bacterium RIFCSPLOWO2_01_FULL_47_18]